MTDHDRAVAWLDAHPEMVEASAARALYRSPDKPPWVGLGGSSQRAYLVGARGVLVAFLTSPLPCATCDGAGRMPVVVDVEPSETPEVRAAFRSIATTLATKSKSCPDCADGTAGILLDQLEARYERIGWRSKELLLSPVVAELHEPFDPNSWEPVFRKLPSPGAE